jgi:hypothetical protein
MMDRKKPDAIRTEVKFVAPIVHYHSVLRWLHDGPTCFSTSYPGRWVNSIYFDSHEYNAFSDGLSGDCSRVKVRYRWYGDSQVPQPGNLEVKAKRNNCGWKLIFPIERAPYRPSASWSFVRDSILRQLDASERRWLHEYPLPALIIRYFRQYFVSKDGHIRATVDSDEEVWAQPQRSIPNFSHQALIPRLCILEFKFHPRDHALASRAIQGIPIRLGRFSKYLTGVGSAFNV